MRSNVLVCLSFVGVLAACGSTPPPAPTTPSSSTPTSATTASSADKVDGATAKKLVKEGAKLLDVRSPEEFATKHIEGATNAPVDAIGSQDLGDKNAPVVVYCGSGMRAARAAETLRSKGYTKVYNLGGMDNWDATSK